MKFSMTGAQGIVDKATRFNDIFLAALVVAIISLMILPLPLWIVDALIATNLTIAVCLIMFSMYIATPLAFSTFPSVLLFTTLFRLALNITTTRQILLNADAGKIIDTFGQMVVAGNFIVGGVVFLIITIVQFLVIAKGSERVAEVAARFTLDAMPGKQMSIDADMRAGVIDMEEAKRRRNSIEKESQLYGAMDGAMKFVKGDAVAGLIVTVVNILGGITIGTLQKDMTISAALQKYSVLTIGDGLISQIPALFISITAGIIVTRVSGGEESKKNLGSDIGHQVLAQPKALSIAGVLLILFAMIPGFPKIQFLLLGSLIGGVGLVMYQRRVSAGEAGEAGDMPPGALPDGGATSARPPSPSASARQDEFSITVPLMIDIASSIQNIIRHNVLNEELVKVRRALYFDLGVPFPGIHLRFNEQLSEGKYVILLQEIPISQGELRRDDLFVKENEDNLKIVGIEYESDKQFLPDLPTIWVNNTYEEQLIKAGIPYMNAPQILTYHLSFILKRHADDFIGLQETKFILEKMESHFAELVREAQRILSIQKITEVLQRLVQEEISIRNMRTILQNLIEWGQKEKDVILLTEYVRMGLKRYISYKYSGGQNILAVYLLDPNVEEMIRKAIRQTSGGSYLALDPEKSRTFVREIKKEVGDVTQRAQRPALLTSMDIRRYVRKLIESELYELPVLSYQELTAEITIQPLSKIAM